MVGSQIYNWLLKQNKYILAGVLLLLFFGFGFNKVLVAEVYGMHEWRMTDGLTFAYKYYKGASFFEPELFCLLSDDLESGKVAGEFPLVYWFVGKLWGVFTYSETIFRLVSFTLTILGFSALYRIVKDVFKSTFIGLGVTVICFSTPIVLYYGASFVTNMHAFSFALVGWYFFYFGYFKNKRFFLHYSAWSFVVGGLLKITAASSLLLLLPFILLSVYKKNKLGVFSVLLALSALVWWYGYFLPEYTTLHGGRFSINGLWPIWDLSSDQINSAIKFFREVTFFQLANPILWLLLPAFVICTFLIKNKEGRFFRYMAAGYLVGFTVYGICWFGAVDGHDYYFTNFLILFFFTLISGLYFLKQYFAVFFQSAIFKIVFGVVVLFSVVYGANNLRMRFCDRLDFLKGFALAFSSDIEPGYWHWMAHNSVSADLRGVDHYLTEQGVEQDARIIYLSDPSFSIEPYAAKRDGYTVQFLQREESRLLQAIDHGSKYFLISNPSDTALAQNYLGEQIGAYGKSLIFKVKK